MSTYYEIRKRRLDVAKTFLILANASALLVFFIVSLTYEPMERDNLTWLLNTCQTCWLLVYNWNTYSSCALPNKSLFGLNETARNTTRPRSSLDMLFIAFGCTFLVREHLLLSLSAAKVILKERCCHCLRCFMGRCSSFWGTKGQAMNSSRFSLTRMVRLEEPIDVLTC